MSKDCFSEFSVESPTEYQNMFMQQVSFSLLLTAYMFQSERSQDLTLNKIKKKDLKALGK